MSSELEKQTEHETYEDKLKERAEVEESGYHDSTYDNDEEFDDDDDEDYDDEEEDIDGQ